MTNRKSIYSVLTIIIVIAVIFVSVKFVYNDFLDEVIKEMLDRKQFETDYSGEGPQKGAD